jgi:DNA modification methylase
VDILTSMLSEEAQDRQSEVIEVEGDIDPHFNIPNQGKILIISNDQSYLTHGIHKFPAKFFPELPRYLIRKYSNTCDIVLDPMCGSGTVVLEALLNKRAAIGIDIDPIARLITKAKTTPIDSDILSAAVQALTTQIQELISSSNYRPSIPEFHYRDNWFRPFVLQELAIISDSIEILLSRHMDQVEWRDIGDFFRVVLSSIIRDVSNADPHCTRTVLRKNVVKTISPGDTYKKFAETLINHCASMSELLKISRTLDFYDVRLPIGNAIETGLDDDSMDLALTSPPYINAVDYPRTHQLEMYWLELVGDGPLSNMKRKYIGTETVYKDEYSHLRTSGFDSLDPLLKKIYSRDPRRSYIVFKFFEDMKNQLMEMYRVLRPKSYYCVVIGNNVIRGNLVKSHEILTEIATSDDIGFKIEKSFFSAVIRHFIKIPRRERMAGEWVLVLRKP